MCVRRFRPRVSEILRLGTAIDASYRVAQHPVATDKPRFKHRPFGPAHPDHAVDRLATIRSGHRGRGEFNELAILRVATRRVKLRPTASRADLTRPTEGCSIDPQELPNSISDLTLQSLCCQRCQIEPLLRTEKTVVLVCNCPTPLEIMVLDLNSRISACIFFAIGGGS